MHEELLTAEEAAQLKGVTRAAVYLAIKEGRLPHTRVLGRLGVRQADVLAWTPIRYGGRPGRKTGRTPGTPLSKETRERIAEAQKRRWAKRKEGSTGQEK